MPQSSRSGRGVFRGWQVLGEGSSILFPEKGLDELDALRRKIEAAERENDPGAGALVGLDSLDELMGKVGLAALISGFAGAVEHGDSS